MSRQSGKKLTGVFAAAVLATLAVGTLPAYAASDMPAPSGVHVQSGSGWDPDGDHHHHRHHHHHDGGKHEGKNDPKWDGKDDGKWDGKDDPKWDGDHDGKWDGKDDPKWDGKDDGKHEGKHKHHRHHRHHRKAFRFATADGKRCLEASGRLARCRHDDDDQLWFRKGGGSDGWQLVNVGQHTCLGAHPGRWPDIKQEKCTHSDRQRWIPFGGQGKQAAPFVNAKFRSKALGRDDRVELTHTHHAPKWKWLQP